MHMHRHTWGDRPLLPRVGWSVDGFTEEHPAKAVLLGPVGIARPGDEDGEAGDLAVLNGSPCLPVAYRLRVVGGYRAGFQPIRGTYFW
jgi:hypothetical protein